MKQTRVRELSRNANGLLEQVVLLVNGTVEQLVVQRAVCPVEERVVHGEAQRDLPHHRPQRRERALALQP